MSRFVTTATIIALLAAGSVPPAVGQEDAIDAGCILLSIELDERDQETLLRIRTDGDPASIGARVEPEGVVLDLGCALGPGLSGQEFAEGLVSALQLSHGAGEQAPTALRIKIRGGFDYSVKTQPDTVLVSLRAEAPPSRKIQVMEPLPLEAPPQVAVEPSQPLSSLESSPPQIQPPSLEPLERQPPQPPDTDIAPIVTAIEDWARSWSDQRIDDYLSAYAADFRPPAGLDRSAWKTQRRDRLGRPSWIEVVLDNIVVNVTGAGLAIATFHQSYSSNTFSDEIEKSLTLVREDDRWRILSETAIPATASPTQANASAPHVPAFLETSPPGTATESAAAATIVEGARISVQQAPTYDDSYQFLPYPGGDPGWDKGSGADLLVRAFRHAGVDLQQRIHEDILVAADVYRVETPDPHIDHRRIRNLGTFLRRHGRELGTDLAGEWLPGDIVFWARDGKRRPDHLGIVTDGRSPDDRPLVIHHEVGGAPSEEDVLSAWTIRGHYRWPATAE